MIISRKYGFALISSLAITFVVKKWFFQGKVPKITLPSNSSLKKIGPAYSPDHPERLSQWTAEQLKDGVSLKPHSFSLITLETPNQ